MKIFILSPNFDNLFGEQQIIRLQQAGELIIEKQVKPFEEVNGLFDDGEKILAIDPDFCDWKVPNEVLDKINNLKAVCLQTTSFSWMDIEFLKKKNIPVANLRGFSSIAVAEWATLMSINLARKIPLIIKDGWNQDYVKHQGIELRGKTAGIIGLGNIGTAIAENLAGLGMTVQYWSRNSKDKRFKFVELGKLMESSDLIIPVVAQNDDTKGLITDDMLKSMKGSAIFVSIVHHVYNHDLLLEMAQAGKIYGYGFEDSKSNFSDYKGNIWAGPELAWCTKDSFQKNAQQWLESIVSASKGEYPTRVN